MNADAMATRMSVLTRALPSRILIVDDDPLEAELMADRLVSAGFDIARASNGEEALALLERQWYPLVITDWNMPVMDGIAFTQALRSRGADDTYIIMLTMRDASVDYERGYISGVDDYLTKKVPDAELFARIHAAFNTLALRRSLRETQAALEQSVTIDAETGAFATSELIGKLHGEVRRAQRYGRQLTVLNIGIQSADDPARPIAAERLKGFVQLLDQTVRAHVDWIGRVATTQGAAFAIVLPEAGVADATVIKERMLNALRRWAESDPRQKLTFTFGVASLERGSGEGTPVGAKEMLDVAERCRACPGHAGQEQLSAVQRSVASHTALVCRHGYFVASECSLKGLPNGASSTRVPGAAAG